ncbi:MAG: Cyanophycinase and related exopeptidase-like protein [Nitrosospira multiformis]|jgi:cyanophycinase-like exopeptidase|nr:Cyanophycinase and related exopeptidase-like protein [Nitrosospira multiformis]
MELLVWFFLAQQQTNSRTIYRLMATPIMVAVFSTGIGLVEAANKSRLGISQNGEPVDYLPCDTIPLSTRTAVLMGGGDDVKEAFGWMIAKMTQCGDGSTGRPGNFVVIDNGSDPPDDTYISIVGPVASVVTLVVPTIETANDPALEPYIRNAGAIWLTGGDQGRYYNFWKGSLLEQLISEQVRNFKIPIGGTSAGTMVLSEFAYVADPCAITSSKALTDPYSQCIALRRDFWSDRTPLPPLLLTVTDSHFNARDRMGRLITFLGHAINSQWTPAAIAQAIGIDEETALLMENDDNTDPSSPGTNYSYKVITNTGVSGSVYILSPDLQSQLNLEPDQPLSFTNVKVRKIQTTGNESDYIIDVKEGSLISNTGSIY